VLIDNDAPFSRLKTLAEELTQTQQMLLHKEAAVLELEKRIEESFETCEKKSE
jgi:tyrosine-protein kinase Fer